MSSKKNRVKIPTKEERITDAVKAIKSDVNNEAFWYEAMIAFASAFRQGNGISWYQGEQAIRKGLENSETIAPTVTRNKEIMADWAGRMTGDITNG